MLLSRIAGVLCVTRTHIHRGVTKYNAINLCSFPAIRRAPPGQLRGRLATLSSCTASYLHDHGSTIVDPG